MKANQASSRKQIIAQRDEFGDHDSTYRESYMHLRDTGLLWSSNKLSTKLRMPPNAEPAFSTVYVCDFDNDLITKHDREVLTKPLKEAKQRNESLQNELEAAID